MSSGNGGQARDERNENASLEVAEVANYVSRGTILHMRNRHRNRELARQTNALVRPVSGFRPARSCAKGEILGF